jgi:uncharacterized membrane protein YfcA
MLAVSDLVARLASLLASVPTGAAGTIAHRRTGLVDVRPGLIVGAAAFTPAVQLSLLLRLARPSSQRFAGLLDPVAVQIGVKVRRGAWF